MNLCIIILGQIRTFFNKGIESLNKMLKISLTKYDKIHIIMIVSGGYDKNQMDFFISQLIKSNISVEIENLVYEEYMKEHNKKIKDNEYLEEKIKYLNQNNEAHKEIRDVDKSMERHNIQFFQLKKGIEKMIEYETKNKILFNLCMKTRFDVRYPENFYPLTHSNDSSILEKIYLNKENNDYFIKKFEDINNLINFLKNQYIVLPKCRTVHGNISLGGDYLNNYISLENIVNGSNNILYMYNDHFIFGNRNEFIKLKNLVHEYGTMKTDLNINHYFAPESQLLIFCFNNKINPIMYFHKCYELIRH